MWLPFAGLIVGVLIGQALTVPIPIQYASYLGVAVLAALDSVLGGLRTMLNNKFDSTIMMSGFFVNSLLAAGLTYIGDRIGIDLHYVAIFVFGVRLFDNLAVIRRTLMDIYFTPHDDKSA
ncbi:MAG: small basic family protein [Firmicutes bacterium]|nr:small basic family protein [Bacillota bacterium]